MPRTKKEKPVLVPPYMVYTALGLGLSTAVAFRAILIFNYLHPSWVRPLWYFAVLGNFVFFSYRFHIAEKRKKAVDSFQLIRKVESLSTLSAEDRDVLTYLLRSIKKSPENINYLIIFVFSLIAIVLDLVFASLY